jgi:diketogulonate reductase-like aldo/keto reductase
MSGVVSIPKASDIAQVRQNVEAADIRLTQQDCDEIDAAFPPQWRKGRLEML